jgi:hypothetical protein
MWSNKNIFLRILYWPILYIVIGWFDDNFPLKGLALFLLVYKGKEAYLRSGALG